MELEGKSVVVVGLARSGIAAARFLARRGSSVVATDRKPAAELPEEALSALAADGVHLELGTPRPETFARAALVVASPGVPPQAAELLAARAAGVPVIGELELGVRHIEGPVAAVTGTKGKSTTTAALGAMLRESGRDVRVGGNIGEAVTGLLEGATAETTFVLEVSSFQLETTDSLRAKVALYTNLSPDHLDRHATFEEYAAAKARIFRNQTEDDYAVVNGDDPAVLAAARAGRARVVRFGHGSDAEAQYIHEDACLWSAGPREDVLFHRADVKVPGEHISMDLLAAGAAARLLGAPPDAIRRAVAAFEGIEHVLERVAAIRGVTFYNDTKATNVDAALKSIGSFTAPVLPILGGRYKGGDFAELRPALAAHGRAVLAIGEAQERIELALRDTLPVVRCASLAEAVDEAYRRARRGDVVLLAPGCSSFDMFTDYAARGRAFKDEVRKLIAREEARG
jgi:UDP-N-acetylmuramoylalanine--D-glutamate ligase